MMLDCQYIQNIFVLFIKISSLVAIFYQLSLGDIPY